MPGDALGALELYCAIDLQEGRAVRLVQGDFARRRTYGDPLELAERFVAAGARWLHVVDLDGARTGTSANRGLVTAISSTPGVQVQVGGGLRTDDDVDEVLAAGAARVVLGTVALEDPEFARRCARRHPHRVALGLDYRRHPDGSAEVATRGWLAASGRSLRQVLAEMAGVPYGAAVVTAIDRDGTLEGPDLPGLAEALDAAEVPLVASGGVGGADHLRQLAALRGSQSGRELAGVVVGKALVDGRVEVAEALEALGRRP